MHLTLQRFGGPDYASLVDSNIVVIAFRIDAQILMNIKFQLFILRRCSSTKNEHTEKNNKIISREKKKEKENKQIK